MDGKEGGPAAQQVSCGDDLVRICTLSCEALDEALALFLESDDPAGPHRARVALRRLTTCLDAFAPMLRQKSLQALRARAKTLFRILGKVRDSDVFVADRIGMPGDKDRLRDNRKTREAARARIRKRKAVSFTGQIRSAVGEGGALLRRRRAARSRLAAPVRDFATGLLDTSWQQALRRGRGLIGLTPPDRHEFRKSVKGLRYLTEFFVLHFADREMQDFLAEVRALQDNLGVLNDFDVALRIEGRKHPPELPAREAAALNAAAGQWTRLVAAPPPWTVQATRLP